VSGGHDGHRERPAMGGVAREKTGTPDLRDRQLLLPSETCGSRNYGAIMEVEQDASTLPSISGLDTVAVALHDPATGIRYAT